MSSSNELAKRLQNRRWMRFCDPFPYVYATDVLSRKTYERVEAAFGEVLSRGLSDVPDGARLSRSMKGYDAYGCTISRESPEGLQFFISRDWHDLLAAVGGVRSAGYVSAGMHHHLVGSEDGFVHNDLNPAYFVDYPTDDGITLLRHDLCDHKTGRTYVSGVKPRELVRSVAMLFYLANGEWHDGDGGCTGLYRKVTDPVGQPAAQVPPLDNSILIFECSPFSFHGFLSNRRTPRNSVIMWLHQEKPAALKKWGKNSIERWS